MFEKKEKRLGQMLLEKKLIIEGQLQAALTEQHETKEFLGTILVNHSIISDQDLVRTLSEQFGIPVVNIKDTYIRWEFVTQFSPALIVEHQCFPLSSDEWSVTFVIVNPLDMWALSRAQEEARGLRAKFALVSQSDMREALRRYREYMRGTIDKLL